jgi:hypothetical protein
VGEGTQKKTFTVLLRSHKNRPPRFLGAHYYAPKTGRLDFWARIIIPKNWPARFLGAHYYFWVDRLARIDTILESEFLDRSN